MQSPPAAQDGSSNPHKSPGPTGCILGIDVGTSSVKAVLLRETAQGPAVLASSSRATKAQVESRTAGPQGNEQDVCKIISALNDCLDNLPREFLGRVSHISVSGQMHGVMFWKANRGCRWTEGRDGWTFEPEDVSPLVTWQDGRCTSQFLSLLPPPASHLGVATGFGCATIFWLLKNSPEFLEPYDIAGTVQDYVVAMLCGQKKPQMTVQNAASWGYFSTTQKSWNVDILREASFPVELLPKVVQSGDLAGGTSHVWHQIPKGTAVVAALGDFQCSVYSSMAESTDAVLNISTSAQLTVMMPKEFWPGESPDPRSSVTYFPYFGDCYLMVAASLNGGNVVATFVDMLAKWIEELGLSQVAESSLYSRIIDAALAQTDTELTVSPTVFGERHTPGRLASVVGISTSELSLGHVTRAVCRGVVRNLHSMLSSERLKEAGVTRILASGSALSKNQVMRQEVEKTYPLPVVYGQDVDAAVGAALVAMHRK